MAAESNNPEDIRAHVKSYGHFSAMMKWGTILSFLTGAIVVLIIAS